MYPSSTASILSTRTPRSAASRAVSDSTHPRVAFEASDARSTAFAAEAVFFPSGGASRTRRRLAAHAARKARTAEALFGLAARGRHARKHTAFVRAFVRSAFRGLDVGANKSRSVPASGAALASSYNTSDARTTSYRRSAVETVDATPRRVEGVFGEFGKLVSFFAPASF